MKKESISVKVNATKQNHNRKDSYNGYFIAKHPTFQSFYKIIKWGGELSSDTGELIFRKFDEKFGFSQTITKYLHLNDERTYCIYENELLFRQKIYQLIAGYHEDDAADRLTHDPVFKQVLDISSLASQPSLSRFLSDLLKKQLANFKRPTRNYSTLFIALVNLKH